MTDVVADRLTRAVREQVALGRLLPLGGSSDGAWITERAAQRVLRRAEAEAPRMRITSLRIGPADPDTAARSAVPPPVSALPPGPLRIGADCVALVGRPLPEAAGRLRAALSRCAEELLGLWVAAIDLRITDLVEELVPAPHDEADDSPREPEIPPALAAVAAAAGAVPGVAGLAAALGGSAQPVRYEDRTDAAGGPAGRHVELQLAVAADHRVLDVSRDVRTAVARTVGAPVTVAVLVTDVR
ncbi:hypothetical protein ACZ90_15970 [Streptomyces albus subsp. albus]|nr:hypothetical protein ACZ90_15970 [Streptomyces albus subsp. albus]